MYAPEYAYRLVRALAGKGDVNIVLTVDGVRSNVATVNIK